MILELDYTQYKAVLQSPHRGSRQLTEFYREGMHLLVSRWARRVNSHQFAIMAFIFDRTFYHSKIGETIVFEQFRNGAVMHDRNEMLYGGIDISVPTLLKQLKALAEDDYIHIAACRNADGNETKPRIYAINCKKLFNLDIADEDLPMILREPKQKKATSAHDSYDENEPEVAESKLRTPRNRVGTPSKIPPKNFEGIYSINTDTKVSIIGGASHAEPGRAIGILERLEADRNARLAAAAERRANAPRRGRSLPASSPYSRANVQNLIDSNMAQHHPNLPRMLVNDKALGVMKKRMAERELELESFLSWAIKFWRTTASGHERAARRRAGEERNHMHKPMPDAPDFNTLSYRLPYFASCYATYVQAEASGLATSREEVLERQVDKLRRQVENKTQEVRSAQERERNMRRRARTAPVEDEAPPVAQRIRTTRPVNLDAAPELDDDLPPAWGELNITRRRTAR